MAIPVLKVLQLVDGKGLRTLAALRKLSDRRADTELRQALATSYKDSLQQLILDLDREALYRLLRRPFRWKDRRYFSPDIGSYTQAQMVSFARTIFMQGEVPVEFGKESMNSELNLDEHFVRPVAKASAALKTAASKGLESDEEVGRTVVAPSVGYLIGLSHDWSRPRIVSAVLRGLGMEVPERLRTSRFQEAVRKLVDLGIEMSDADSGKVLTHKDPSPGVDGKVRLRKIARP
ncbi:hypothetical protein LXT21_12650 [Myxococcus sp. K38C18041901]|uniref:hypothetical protein n=1 Tax=Myxococcus guangdongensis TaxID=2906760 RepID=UPI0020A6DCBD|nr:hypothetical protein [Myxococcus guangdongensis]MCP3059628.1 hypothetical protein [Myxococcus guangdongensis]